MKLKTIAYTALFAATIGTSILMQHTNKYILERLPLFRGTIDSTYVQDIGGFNRFMNEEHVTVIRPETTKTYHAQKYPEKLYTVTINESTYTAPSQTLFFRKPAAETYRNDSIFRLEQKNYETLKAKVALQRTRENNP